MTDRSVKSIPLAVVADASLQPGVKQVAGDKIARNAKSTGMWSNIGRIPKQISTWMTSSKRSLCSLVSKQNQPTNWIVTFDSWIRS